MNFELVSKFSPTGDQPQAITQLVDGLMEREEFQTLLGVTGSGKTFTIANVIKQVNRPTLVLSHNKTLAAQLYSEFKQFFPNNAVEYFVSYYDYYQPEAYIPSTGTYIEKDLSINKEIEKLRLNTTSSLLSGRKDIIVVSSVSCIYGIGNPEDFNAGMIEINCGDLISRNHLLQKLVTALYSRTEAEFERGNFRVKGDTVDIYPAYTDIAFRVHFFGSEIEVSLKASFFDISFLILLPSVIIALFNDSTNSFNVTFLNLGKGLLGISSGISSSSSIISIFLIGSSSFPKRISSILFIY